MSNPPKAMRYASQAIVYIAADLEGNARSLQGKREASTDKKNPYGYIPASRIFSFSQITALPIEYRQHDSRLIILGHGDEDSTVIGTAQQGGVLYDHLQLRTEVEKWFGGSDVAYPTRVQRISLHMCFGAGNRKNVAVTGSSASFNQFNVSPFNSFAFKFARICGDLTVDVTARAAETNMNRNSLDGVITNAKRQVAGRHHAEGDKWRFVTDVAGCPDTPKDPEVFASYNKGEQKFR